MKVQRLKKNKAMTLQFHPFVGMVIALFFKSLHFYPFVGMFILNRCFLIVVKIQRIETNTKKNKAIKYRVTKKGSIMQKKQLHKETKL